VTEPKLFETDSEVAVLSILLKNPELIHSTNGLKYFMFSATPHIAMFEEFEELLERQLVPDPTLVYSDLEAKNKLDSIGGKSYFEMLMSKEFSVESYEQLVKNIISSYKARSLLSITSSVKKDRLSATNVDDEIYELRRSLDKLAEDGGNATASTFQISDIAQGVYEEILERSKNPGIRGHSWGLETVDSITGGKCAGDLWVIAGRPGMGKTAAVVNSIYEDGKNGIPSLLIEREMRSQELTERLIAVDTGIANSDIRKGLLKTEQIGQVYESLKKLSKFPIYLDTSYYSSDPYYLESVVNKYRNKKGVEIVYLDYLQILVDRDESQTQDIGKLTRMFKLMCNDLNITTVLLSQLNRNVEYREDKRPMLSDMRQAGAIEEDADFVVGLYRDEQYNTESKFKGLMEYIVLKHRNGPTGTLTLNFDGPTNRITG